MNLMNLRRKQETKPVAVKIQKLFDLAEDCARAVFIRIKHL